MTYDLIPIQAPRMAGTGLKALTAALESSLTRWMLLPKLLRDAGIEQFRARTLTEAPSVRPPLPGRGALADGGGDEGPDGLALCEAAVPGPGYRFETVADFARAYRAGDTTPVEVARRLLAACAELDERDPAMRLLIAQDADDVMAQAEAAAARFERGEPLGVFDGVPVAVKDELEQVPYPTTVGTAFLGREPATEDATVVARFREQGALLLGKTAMHEIGIGVTGLNPHHGTPRNPYDPAHFTGGSSSGPAAVVAAGLCPVAIGADGGGSIRTPAALCGVVGLKATYGRISEHGAFPLCWSVGHVGPLAATALDTALAYRVMGGFDPADPYTGIQPTPTLAGVDDRDLTGVTVGVYRAWFEDAEPDVVAAADAGLRALEERGATVREVELPDLELARVAHLISIASEMLTSMTPLLADHRRELGLDVRINLALAAQFTNVDYVCAQRVRTRIYGHFARVLDEVDAIVTPTTGRTAPPIRPDALAVGESDLVSLSQIMRFIFPPNLTGHPAISVPTGYDGAGLPVGLQLIGRPWEEHRILQLAGAVEAEVERREPAVHVRLLSGS